MMLRLFVVNLVMEVRTKLYKEAMFLMAKKGYGQMMFSAMEMKKIFQVVLIVDEEDTIVDIQKMQVQNALKVINHFVLLEKRSY